MMRKTTIPLLILCVCVILCSCTMNKAEVTEPIMTTDHIDANYVGIWSTTNTKYDAFPTSIRLLSNGRALLQITDAYSIQNAPWSIAAEWMVEDNNIIIFYEYDGSEDFPYSQAYIFKIESEDKMILPMLEISYTKE